MNYLKDLRTFKSGAVLGKSDLQKFIGVEKNLPSSLQKHLDNLAWAPQIYNFISKVYRRPCFSFFLKKKSYIVKHIWLPCGISICQKSTVNANIVSKLSAFHDYFPHLWFLECTWATDCSHVTPPKPLHGSIYLTDIPVSRWCMLDSGNALRKKTNVMPSECLWWGTP